MKLFREGDPWQALAVLGGWAVLLLAWGQWHTSSTRLSRSIAVDLRSAHRARWGKAKRRTGRVALSGLPKLARIQDRAA